MAMASLPTAVQKKRQEEGSILQDTDHAKRVKTESNLPLDIIIEVLSRTPGSSLVRFRLVCKLWYLLTYDDRLIASHLERALMVDPPQIIIFSQDAQGQQKYHLTVLDEAWHTKFRLTRASDAVLTTPPCNGLICLYDYHRNITLCNPTTRDFLTLPKPTVDSRSVTNSFPKCSFGFHPSTKKYKVVRFFYLRMNHKTKTYVLGCEIFTLGISQSWRYIGDIHSYITGSGINVNGSIYWTTDVTAPASDKIIILDLATENFSTIDPPDVAGYKIDRRLFLVQLEGNLCIVNAPFGPSPTVEIWMLKGPDNIWIHRFRVRLMNAPEYHQSRPQPMFIHQDKLFLEWAGNLYYFYGLQDKKKKFVTVYKSVHPGSGAKFYPFVESLEPLRL